MEFVAIFGCFVMVILPILFVVALVVAITKQSKGWTVATVAIGVVGVVAVVVALAYTGKEAAGKLVEKSQPRVFLSSDGLVQVTAPGSWREQDFENEVASLQLGNLISNEYLLVISEEKRGFAPEVGIEEYAEWHSEHVREVLEDPSETELIPLKIGSLKGLRRELDGRIEGLSVSYLNTFIEGKDHFHQVLTWTLTEKKDPQFPRFRTVVDSFEEVPVEEE